ncbi:MAG: hypothetical protein WCR72_10315 [Bacteroidota bacterium]
MKTNLASLKRNLKLFVTLCFFAFSIMYTAAQNNNFYSLVVQQDRHFDSLIQIRGSDNMKGTGYRPYLRWKLYWMSKINNGESIEGANNALRNYTNNFKRNKDNFILTPASWQPLGPFTWPNNINYSDTTELTGTIGVGRIHALVFDPSNANRVFAMSPSWGGLYRSDNNGSSWIKIQTDDVEFEGFGNLLVDNTNSNILYLVNGDSDANV